MTFNSDFITKPLKGKSSHLIGVVKARFEVIAPKANPFNEYSLCQSASFCIAPLVHVVPLPILVAVKSNIIEELKRAAGISLVG